MRLPCKVCSGKGFHEVTPQEEVAQRIIREAATDWSIYPEDITGPSRRQNIVEARRYVARDLRQRGFQLKQIGQALGNRDHATIINLIRGKERS